MEKNVWSSGRNGQKSNNYYLVIDNNGVLTILNSQNPSYIWGVNSLKKITTKKIEKQIFLNSTNLEQKVILNQGYSLVSENRKYSFDVDYSSGRVFMFYYPNTVSYVTNKIMIWAASGIKEGKSPVSFSLNSNGNLELKDRYKNIIWQSNSIRPFNLTSENNVRPNYNFIITNNGNAVVLDSQLHPIWDIKRGAYPIPPPIVKKAKVVKPKIKTPKNVTNAIAPVKKPKNINKKPKNITKKPKNPLQHLKIKIRSK